MSKAVIVIIIGALIAFSPFLGFPSAFMTGLTVILGIALIVLGLLMRVERLWLIRALSGGHKTDAYAENGAPQKQHSDSRP